MKTKRLANIFFLFCILLSSCDDKNGNDHLEQWRYYFNANITEGFEKALYNERSDLSIKVSNTEKENFEFVYTVKKGSCVVMVGDEKIEEATPFQFVAPELAFSIQPTCFGELEMEIAVRTRNDKNEVMHNVVLTIEYFIQDFTIDYTLTQVIEGRDNLDLQGTNLTVNNGSIVVSSGNSYNYEIIGENGQQLLSGQLTEGINTIPIKQVDRKSKKITLKVFGIYDTASKNLGIEIPYIDIPALGEPSLVIGNPGPLRSWGHSQIVCSFSFIALNKYLAYLDWSEHLATGINEIVVNDIGVRPLLLNGKMSFYYIPKNVRENPIKLYVLNENKTKVFTYIATFVTPLNEPLLRIEGSLGVNFNWDSHPNKNNLN